jgi:hypothetical protein
VIKALPRDDWPQADTISCVHNRVICADSNLIVSARQGRADSAFGAAWKRQETAPGITAFSRSPAPLSQPFQAARPTTTPSSPGRCWRRAWPPARAAATNARATLRTTSTAGSASRPAGAASKPPGNCWRPEIADWPPRRPADRIWRAGAGELARSRCGPSAAARLRAGVRHPDLDGRRGRRRDHRRAYRRLHGSFWPRWPCRRRCRGAGMAIHLGGDWPGPDGPSGKGCWHELSRTWWPPCPGLLAGQHCI